MRSGLFVLLRSLVFACLIMGVAMFHVGSADAAVTQQFSYQGRLSDSANAPVANSVYTMKFSLYTAASGGTPIWTAAGTVGSPTGISVSVTSSLFSVALGDVAGGQNTLEGVDWNQDTLYLGITIGADGEMTPRRRLTAAPQALYAADAFKLQGMSASSTAYGGQTLFTIHQTETSAATGTRSALDVKSAGMSDENDFLLRGINSSGTTVFTLNRQGYVTSTASATGASTATTSTVNALFTNRLTAGMNITHVGTYEEKISAAYHTKIVGTRLYVQDQTSVRIFDISDPSAQHYLGTVFVDLTASVASFDVRGNIVYIAYQDALLDEYFSSYNATNATNPVLLSTIAVSGATNLASGVVLVHGRVAYVGGAVDGKVFVYDISDPSGTTLEHTIEYPGYTLKQLRIHNGDLYVLASGGADSRLYGYDIEDIFRPAEISSTAFAVGVEDVVMKGGVAYVAVKSADELNVVNIYNRTTPVIIGAVSSPDDPDHLFEIGGRLFVGGGSPGVIHIYDTTSSTNPTFVGTLMVGGFVQSFAGKGNTLFIGKDVAGAYVGAYNLPGAYIDTITSGQASLYRLDVDGDASIAQNLMVNGSVSVGAGGLISQGPIAVFGSSTTSSIATFINRAPTNAAGFGWGVATNRLLVGDDIAASGTQSYVSLFGYNSTQSRFGVCLDDLSTATTCIDFASTSTVYSLLADDAIGANAFDLAERYTITDAVESGDVLVLDANNPLQMKKSTGTPYDTALAGVVSTRPGFLLGTGGTASVALVGRVPVKVSISNGTIIPGDPLTSSDQPGIAMKATRPGKILGRALQPANADGVIEVYLQPGYDATGLFEIREGVLAVKEPLVFVPETDATANIPTQNSRALRFAGSVWNGTQAVAGPEFRLFTNATSMASSSFMITQASSTLFSLAQDGSLALSGDLALAGRLYPSARGHAQTHSYIFADDSQAGGTYISTNANGWQSMDGYDYAERYASPDALEPGDVVAVKRGDRVYVQRSSSERDALAGIVSTKPGFIAGRPEEGNFPIALAGRVPTKVSAMHGAIMAGDALTASTIPGVAVKATRAGQIIGTALENYSGGDVGKIEVFVNPGWWGGFEETTKTPSEGKVTLAKARGFAEIKMGQIRVHVATKTLTRYPHIQVTPYTQTEHGWWMERVSIEGFDLVLGEAVGRNVRFAWSAEDVPDENSIALSIGRVLTIDPITGMIVYPDGEHEDTQKTPVAPAQLPTQEPVQEPVVEETPSSTETVLPDTVSTDTEPTALPTEEPVIVPEPVLAPEPVLIPEPTPEEPVVSAPSEPTPVAEPSEPAIEPQP